MTMHNFVAASILSFVMSAAMAGTIQGRIVGIADGDTVTILDEEKTQHKIRLGGIDAPEKKQAFGNRSKETLSDCAFGKQATVETGKRDRYGRWVGKVVVNGQDCNLRQIQLGMAWHYKKYQSEQTQSDRAEYDAAELKARAARQGLWQDAEPIPPWEFRKPGR